MMTRQTQECRVPCIMEGETGVSKTALTRMLFILKNQPSLDDERHRPDSVRELRQAVDAPTVNPAHRDALVTHRDENPVLLALQRVALSVMDYSRTGSRAVPTEEWKDAARLAIFLCTSHDDVSARCLPQLCSALICEVLQEPGLLASRRVWHAIQPMPWGPFVRERMQGGEEMADLLVAYVEARMQANAAGTSWTFHQLNVHAALTPVDIESDLAPTIELGQRLMDAAKLLGSKRHKEVNLCIFLDEVNTSSTMGVFTELIIDRRLNGRDLPSNIVVIAACNPAREKLVHLSDVNARREELGKEWAMGHYQVHPLPLSIEMITWDYGALTKEQEEEFVTKRLAALYRGSDVRFPVHEQLALAALMCKAQTLTREFARQHFTTALRPAIIAAAEKRFTEDGLRRLDADLNARASSVVSLRDIQRVFSLFKFFNGLLETHYAARPFFVDEMADESEKRRRATLLTIGVVYYLRLSPAQRASFEHELHELQQERYIETSLQLSGVLDDCMDRLIAETQVESDIARTTGLKENVFMVVVCCLARVPLMIVSSRSRLPSHCAC